MGFTNGIYGRVISSGKDVGAHRASFEEFNGPIPEGMMVRHRCDTPLCINPFHLVLGTASDNGRDMKERGRSKTGMDRLGEAVRNQIIARYHAGESPTKLAEEYGVAREYIHQMVRKRREIH
jgi:hypothetical protein